MQNEGWLAQGYGQRTQQVRIQQSTNVLTKLLDSTGVNVGAAVDGVLMSSPALLKGRADTFFDEVTIQGAAQVRSY